MVPTGTGKQEGIFQSGKSQGIYPKILEKSEKNCTGKMKKYWKSQGNLSASNSEKTLQIWYHALNKKEH